MCECFCSHYSQHKTIYCHVITIYSHISLLAEYFSKKMYITSCNSSLKLKMEITFDFHMTIMYKLLLIHVKIELQ